MKWKVTNISKVIDNTFNGFLQWSLTAVWKHNPHDSCYRGGCKAGIFNPKQTVSKAFQLLSGCTCYLCCWALDRFCDFTACSFQFERKVKLFVLQWELFFALYCGMYYFYKQHAIWEMRGCKYSRCYLDYFDFKYICSLHDHFKAVTRMNPLFKYNFSVKYWSCLAFFFFSLSKPSVNIVFLGFDLRDFLQTSNVNSVFTWIS